MSTYSSLIVVTAVTLGLCAFAGYALLLIQSARQNKRIQQLESRLEVFVDSSISVAKSVDQLINTGPHQNTNNVASRRWVLQEAKSRLMQGETLLDIAAPLGLSKDEVRLLNTQIH